MMVCTNGVPNLKGIQQDDATHAVAVYGGGQEGAKVLGTGP